MILGIPTSTYTLIHVVLSLIGIGSGVVALFGLFKARRLDRWTAVFLMTTAATSLTAFGFPFDHLVPALKALAPTQSEAPFLIVQLFVLATFVALTIVALRRFRVDHLGSPWQKTS